jgi:hypothetical protein
MRLRARLAKLEARADRLRPGVPEWFTDALFAELCWAYGGSSVAGAIALLRGWMAESAENERAMAPFLALFEGIGEGGPLPWEA